MDVVIVKARLAGHFVLSPEHFVPIYLSQPSASLHLDEGSQPPRRLSFDQPQHNFPKSFRGIRKLRRLGCLIERRDSFDHLVNNGSHRIKICSVAISLKFLGLIGHVLRTAALRMRHILPLQVDAAEPKVPKMHMSFQIHHDIFRLNVRWRTFRSR